MCEKLLAKTPAFILYAYIIEVNSELYTHSFRILTGIKNIGNVNVFTHHPINNFIMAFRYPAVIQAKMLEIRFHLT